MKVGQEKVNLVATVGVSNTNLILRIGLLNFMPPHKFRLYEIDSIT
jgi:hypothetical protein